MRFLAAALSLGLALVPLQAQSKRSIAIEPFDFSTIQTDVQAIFGTTVDVGRGISSLLVKRIAESGCYTVVERNKLGVLMKEQDLGASGRVKKGTQARIGQIRGADFTMLGDIVTFGRDDQRKSGGVGVYVPGAGGGAAGGYKKTDKAVVTLNFRMTDSESSEIVAAGEARGESSRPSKGGFAGFFAGGVLAGGFADFSSSNFGQTIIGEAVIDAVNKLATQVKCEIGSSRPNVAIDARVASVNGNVVYINAGSASGVQVGDTFDVNEITGEVRDPTTKEVLDIQSSPIGKLTISTVREKIAFGTYSGSKPPKPGDQAEKK